MMAVAAWVAAAVAAFPARGASITYLNNSGVTDLSDGAAWDGGVAPGAGKRSRASSGAGRRPWPPFAPRGIFGPFFASSLVFFFIVRF